MPDEAAVPNIVKNEIYLRKGADFVGPFHSFEDAERFLQLMTFFGEDCSDVKIVEINQATKQEDSRTESGFSDWTR